MSYEVARGFTLIELLVVVLIIGILASVALPEYKMAVHKARIRSYLPTLRSIAEAEELYYLVNNDYASMTEREELDITFPQSCTLNPVDDWRMNCGNHITLVTIGNLAQRKVGAVGMLYCYNSSQPCGDNYDMQFLKVLQNQYAGSPFASAPGNWGCGCRLATDKFCAKLCTNTKAGLNK